MKKMIRNFIPSKIWYQLSKWKIQIKYLKLRKDILHYYYNLSNITLEQQEVIDFLKNNFIDNVFPYNFIKKYKNGDINVYLDEKSKTFYVLHQNKRMYFKKAYDRFQIQDYYRRLLIEQDKDSPHLYETETFHVSDGDIVADLGAAEGVFALSVIDRVSKIYIFESDQGWIDALKLTFSPYKEKVIINYNYVSDNDINNNISLDTYFANQPINFIKADIEGAETLMLAGAKQLLSTIKSNNTLKIILCTYHHQNDAKEIENSLKNFGFKTNFSMGYMIYYPDQNIYPPFLRRGLIRAKK